MGCALSFYWWRWVKWLQYILGFAGPTRGPSQAQLSYWLLGAAFLFRRVTRLTSEREYTPTHDQHLRSVFFSFFWKAARNSHLRVVRLTGINSFWGEAALERVCFLLVFTPTVSNNIGNRVLSNAVCMMIPHRRISSLPTMPLTTKSRKHNNRRAPKFLLYSMFSAQNKGEDTREYMSSRTTTTTADVCTSV